MAIKPDRGGGEALMARPLREELFFAVSLRILKLFFVSPLRNPRKEKVQAPRR